MFRISIGLLCCYFVLLLCAATKVSILRFSFVLSDLRSLLLFLVYVHNWNIIMAKGKGRQSGGFASKAQKAQFHTELLERVTEDAAARRRRIPKPISVKERPKIRLQSLQYILRERQ